MANEPDDEIREFASPACFMHELDPAYTGLPPPREEVMRWRKEERARLIAKRLAVPAAERAAMTEGIVRGLDELLGDPAARVVSVYWPFRGEPDLRGWMAGVTARGGICALPIVREKKAPLVFRAWKEGDRMERGIWNILVPADGPDIRPDVVIAPLVGFDPACFRLGYGGGYFDRTLATFAEKPLVVGVGYGHQAIATIHPQPHDIPMDVIVTEAGIAHRRP
ncbi:MAG TPA: 5-formyltetrahydrofolate cyclo-ligase [Geminicoccus sp.]|jgi:5,10-methenyltetrahydrofolate synthetase|uniref:5-formyltetrahydrofolate cyclo-ligase n=1 Tax=Geminicoccus sp. TaxID=2024832 RepID=UPI002E328869|nr:5-formyltetrahydrofolate cyclo-ligase [Geminicoccus sp.]HEX2525461.1 5-formyltetrahydrofolate cyclo-ligase [Geminicoccus sp.]